MPKFYGKIGFAETVEIRPGVWTDQIVERPYFGDLNRDSRQSQSSDQVNDEINIANEISIVSDMYALNHINAFRYAEFMGVKWKISRVEIKPPRLILTLGGVYNGPQIRTANYS